LDYKKNSKNYIFFQILACFTGLLAKNEA